MARPAGPLTAAVGARGNSYFTAGARRAYKLRVGRWDWLGFAAGVGARGTHLMEAVKPAPAATSALIGTKTANWPFLEGRQTVNEPLPLYRADELLRPLYKCSVREGRGIEDIIMFTARNPANHNPGLRTCHKGDAPMPA